MSFPLGAVPVLYFRNRTRIAPVQKIILEGDDVDRLSEDGRFLAQLTENNEELKIKFRQIEGQVVYLERFELVYGARDKKSPITLHPDIPADTSYHLFQQGHHSWAATRKKESGEVDQYANQRWKQGMGENPQEYRGKKIKLIFGSTFLNPGRFHSESLVGLEERDSENPASILVSIAYPGRQFVRYRVHLHPETGHLQEFSIIWDFNGEEFKPHAITSLTAIRWQINTHEQKNPEFALVLNENIQAIARNFDPHMTSDTSLSGWSSWSCYNKHISEDIILNNLRALKEQDLDLNYFQIDQGYQKHIGDWLTPNRKFPSGMKYLADEIRKAGYRPGLWLAPFTVQPGADLYRDHPEMVLRKVNAFWKPVRANISSNWWGRNYVLDVTNPITRDWLAEVIDTVVNKWGFSLLKLDYLYVTALRGIYYKSYSTGATRLRDSLKLIRRVAGRKTFLMGCECPYFPAMGHLDSLRIGMDLNNHSKRNWWFRKIMGQDFSAMHSALPSIMASSAYHRRVFINEPDCLMLRNNNDEHEEHEIRLTASVMALSGGMMVVGDDLTSMQQERHDLMRPILRINQECSRYTPYPLGLMDYDFPRGLYNPAGYLGVWNPSPRPEWIRIKLPFRMNSNTLRRSRDLWTGEKMTWKYFEGGFQIALGPYETRVAKIL